MGFTPVCSANTVLLCGAIFGIIVILPSGLMNKEVIPVCQCEPRLEFFANGGRNCNNDILFEQISKSQESIRIIISESYFNDFGNDLRALLLRKKKEGLDIKILSSIKGFSFPECNIREFFIPGKKISIFLFVFDRKSIYIPSSASFIGEKENIGSNHSSFALFVRQCLSLAEDAWNLFDFLWNLANNPNLSTIKRIWYPNFSYPSLHVVRESCFNNDFDNPPNSRPFLKFSLSKGIQIQGRNTILSEILSLIGNRDSQDLKIYSPELIHSSMYGQPKGDAHQFFANIEKLSETPSNIEFFIGEHDFGRNFQYYKRINWMVQSTFRPMKVYSGATIITSGKWTFLAPVPLSEILNESVITFGITIQDFMVLSEASMLFYHKWDSIEPYNLASS